MGQVRHVLAGYDEGGAGGGGHQQQRLEEPVQAHFALPRLEAEGAALGAEQQHALRQAQAVLWRRGDVTERLGSAPVARGDSESLLLHLIVQVHKNKMIRLGSSTAT